MQVKQSQVPPSPILSTPTLTPANISNAEIFKDIMSFPNGTAPGPSSLRASQLKEVVQCLSPDHAAYSLKAITETVNLLSSRHVPSEFVPYLCGTTLLPNRRKNGGLRPFAWLRKASSM